MEVPYYQLGGCHQNRFCTTNLRPNRTCGRSVSFSGKSFHSVNSPGAVTVIKRYYARNHYHNYSFLLNSLLKFGIDDT